MSYKTILVHLNERSRAAGLVSYARDIAQTFGSHMTGLYVTPTPPVPLTLGLPFADEVAARIRSTFRDEEAATRAAFEAGLADTGVPHEWRAVASGRRDPADVVLEHARIADVVVASQADPDWDLSPTLDIPDRLALESGRPVIVVPTIGRFAGPPRRILVGWSGRRESARALADAMPLLRKADMVNIVTVEDSEESNDTAMANKDLVAALSRHGVEVDASRLRMSEFTVGEELRSRAMVFDADMIVVGCYGHSRFREMALGGVTRHLLRDTTLPLLMSH